MEVAKRELSRRSNTLGKESVQRERSARNRPKKVLQRIAVAAYVVVMPVATLNSPAAGESSGASISDTAARSAQGSISVGYGLSCAITNSGGVSCWGQNSYGKLGNGTTGGASSNPVTVLATGQPIGGLALSGVTAIDSRDEFTCALMASRSVKCWGLNWAGMLGDGTTTNRSTPVDVVGLTEVREISVGSYHACALMQDTTVKCWGHNGSGQLGDGTTTDRLTPTPVVATGQTAGGTALSGITAISAGGSHMCALTNSGGVKCWGSNQSGALGDGTTNRRLTPVDVVATGQTSGGTALSGITAISAGGYFTTCAITTSQGMKCWGENGNGQIGDGTTTQRTTPVDVLLTAGTALSDVRTISVGSNHTCASLTSNLLRCWGWNFAGRLGDGTETQRVNPVSVLQSSTPLSGVTAVAAGSTHTCALTSSGTTKCWGQNGAGQLGNGNTTTQLTAVDVSSFSSFVPDTTPPTITINRSGTGTLLRGQTESVTFQLSESSSDFSATDVTAVNALISNFSGSGTTYSATVTPTPDSSGTITLDVASSTFTDAGGNSNTAASQLSIQFNTLPPATPVPTPMTTTTLPSTPASAPSAPQSTVPNLGGATNFRNGQAVASGQMTVKFEQGESRIVITHDDGSELRVVKQSNERDDTFVFNRGSTFEVKGSGYLPKTTVEVWLNSDPVRIGTVTSDSLGRFTASVQIPQDFELGPHSLRVDGATKLGDQVTRIGISVERSYATLPTTGTTHLQLTLLSLILVWSGLLVIRRKRSL